MIDPSRTIALKTVVSESAAILAPFFQKTAREEARRIIADVLSVTPSKIRLDMDRMTVDEQQEKDIIAKTRRRAKHEPLQYIAGSACFMGEEFQVGEGVLIPRGDTEILVEEAIKIAIETLSLTSGKPAFCPETIPPETFRFLEFCTGSGCIALSFIKKMKESGWDISGLVTDLSPEALFFAEQNAQRLGCSDRIRIVQQDMMSDVSCLAADHGPFQMILANPPYIRTDVIADLEPEVALYEPRIALDGGKDGLVFHRRILECARTLLSPGGWILIEIGYDQENKIRKLFDETGLFETTSVKKDYGGNPRLAIGRRKG